MPVNVLIFVNNKFTRDLTMNVQRLSLSIPIHHKIQILTLYQRFHRKNVQTLQRFFEEEYDFFILHICTSNTIYFTVQYIGMVARYLSENTWTLLWAIERKSFIRGPFFEDKDNDVLKIKRNRFPGDFIPGFDWLGSTNSGGESEQRATEQ